MDSLHVWLDWAHISALLYWVEYMVRKREEESCTSKPNSWLEPHATKHIPYLPLDTIDFTSSEKWMKAYQHGEVLTTCAESRARDVRLLPVHSSMIDTDTVEFYDSALAGSSKPIVLSVLMSHTALVLQSQLVTYQCA